MNNKEFIDAFESLPEPSDMIRIMLESYELKRRDICNGVDLSNSNLTRILKKSSFPSYLTYRKLVVFFCNPTVEKES